MRRILMVFLFFIFATALSFSQDCSNCQKRRVHVYDFEIDWPIPVASPDSIGLYVRAFHIASSIGSYLKLTDPTKDCLVSEYQSLGGFFDSARAVADPATFGNVARNLDSPPDVTNSYDYIIKGIVFSPMPGNDYCIVHADLYTGPSGESVGSGYGALYPGSDPMEVAQHIMGVIGPLYQTLMKFEKNKRDEGHPYAIYPNITLTAADTIMDFGEVTTIHVEAKDCDGEPLKDRHISLAVNDGTLGSSIVTTNDQGSANVQFTAGTHQVIAIVQGNYQYTTPYGKNEKAMIEPASIQIRPPDSCYYVYASYHLTRTGHTDGIMGDEVTHDENITNTYIHFAAWVKAYLFFGFLNQSPPIWLWYGGERNIIQHYDYEWNLGDASFQGHTYRDWYASFGAEDTNAVLDLIINSGFYTFGISNINAEQTGTVNEASRLYTAITGLQTSDTTYNAPPTDVLDFDDEDFSQDTSYTVNESDPGTGTTENTNVNQTFAWDGKVCKLRHTSDRITETHMSSGGYTLNDYAHQFIRLWVDMEYNGSTSGVNNDKTHVIPIKYALSQNYPNPFNPTTTIEYDIPKASFVTLKVFNMLGQEVKTLVDKKQEAGSYDAILDGSKLPSGVYIYRLQTENYLNTKKLILIK
jgi:Secretion system C-terminal sorting domain